MLDHDAFALPSPLTSCPPPLPSNLPSLHASSTKPARRPSTFYSDGVLLSFQGLDVSRLLHGALALNGDRQLIIELSPCIQAGRPQQDHTHLEGWGSVFNLVSPSALRPGSRGQRGYVTERKRSLIPMAKTTELLSPLCSGSVAGWLGLCAQTALKWAQPLRTPPRLITAHVSLAKTSDMTTPNSPGAGKCNSIVCLHMVGIFVEQHYDNLPAVA